MTHPQNTSPTQRSRKRLKEVERRLESEDQGVCWETASSSQKLCSWTVKTWADKDNSNRHAKADEGKSMRPQPYTKKGMQLGNAENGGISLLQGRAYLLVLQHQMANPENASVCVTSYRLSRSCLEIYMHIHNNEWKRTWIWKRKGRGRREDLEGDKGMEKWCDYIKTWKI